MVMELSKRASMCSSPQFPSRRNTLGKHYDYENSTLKSTRFAPCIVSMVAKVKPTLKAMAPGRKGEMQGPKESEGQRNIEKPKAVEH